MYVFSVAKIKLLYIKANRGDFVLNMASFHISRTLKRWFSVQYLSRTHFILFLLDFIHLFLL